MPCPAQQTHAHSMMGPALSTDPSFLLDELLENEEGVEGVEQQGLGAKGGEDIELMCTFHPFNCFEAHP